MVLVPNEDTSFWMFRSRLFTVASTPIMQNIPMVIPNSERKVRSLFFHSSCRAMIKLLPTISIVRRIMVQIYDKQRSEEVILYKWPPHYWDSSSYFCSFNNFPNASDSFSSANLNPY